MNDAIKYILGAIAGALLAFGVAFLFLKPKPCEPKTEVFTVVDSIYIPFPQVEHPKPTKQIAIKKKAPTMSKPKPGSDVGGNSPAPTWLWNEPQPDLSDTWDWSEQEEPPFGWETVNVYVETTKADKYQIEAEIWTTGKLEYYKPTLTIFEPYQIKKVREKNFGVGAAVLMNFQKPFVALPGVQLRYKGLNASYFHNQRTPVITAGVMLNF